MEQSSELYSLTVSRAIGAPGGAIEFLLHLIPRCPSMHIEEIRLGTERHREVAFGAFDWEMLDITLAQPQFMGLRRLGFCMYAGVPPIGESGVITEVRERLPMCHARGILVVDTI
jgi:hypothetical protein